MNAWTQAISGEWGTVSAMSPQLSRDGSPARGPQPRSIGNVSSRAHSAIEAS